ncbi:MAG TPA: hypothetical protein VG722_03775 [Tepidisphaeraceae bacterium]|nr:hypothetical protein [Tepidisphaeraceae bacterium]
MGQSSDEEFNAEEQYPRAAPVMVWITLLIFLGIMVMLAYRWVNMAEPNGFILVNGNDSFAGAVVSVGSADGTDLESTARLTEANGFRARFPLPQGIYLLTVDMKGEVILKEPIQLREASGMICTLDPKMLPTTQPTTQPSDTN